MSLAIVHSRALVGVEAPPVTIEVHLSKGLPDWSMVGLPEKAVKESKERVRSALLNCHFELPAKRITINLAPADLPKEGGRFDLPIALGILAALGSLPQEALDCHEFAGELALTGDLLPIKGALPFAMAMQTNGRSLVLPQASAEEGALAGRVMVYGARHIMQVYDHLHHRELLTPLQKVEALHTAAQYPDLIDVRGQPHARRALEIAASGGHSILLKGPPGTGKTMLASRLPGILPLMTEQEALVTAAVYSVSTQGFHVSQWRKRPFRTPHHSASSVALVGGGSPPRPGEISLAQHGVLFLDELPEFSRQVLEGLREPLEAGHVTISRATRQAQFPAAFQLVAAMNPCPCGYYGDPKGRCRCTAEHVQRYQSRISGPLLDRIDMHIEVPPLPVSLMFGQTDVDCENSATVRQRVLLARERQWQRDGKANAALSSAEIKQSCVLGKAERDFMELALNKLGLSARAYNRVLKLARTVADLSEALDIRCVHLQEALTYRK